LNVWELIIQQPLTNILIVVSHYLGGNFGMSIIFLTVIVNLALYPLTRSQIKSAQKMQELQPKLAELQKKYAKDRQKLSQEQMRLYKESGVKPAGCLFSMFIQMPVWIALYQSIMLALAVAPEALLKLSNFLYPWDVVYASLPLSRDFLMMDLANPNMILAILVGVTMWVQQKMSTTPSPDPKQAQSSQMMLWMMPMLFTFMALSFPAGLSLYWVTSSVFRIVLQYRVAGWGGLRRQAPPPAESERRPLRFDTSRGKKSVEETDADIVVTDKGPSKDNMNPYKAGKSKFRFLTGKDKDQHRPKK
jgi:YidC/Oxa1 family membrane protein insertase